MKPDFAILQALASAHGAGQKTMWDAGGEALQALIDRLHCSRISLWRFEIDGGARALRCFAAKRAGEALVADDTLLSEDHYREYFSDLIRTGMFVSSDALAEPSLAAMRAVFVKKFRIGASLDVAVTINGRAYGVVCCEQIPGPREWRPGDIAAARAAVARAALLIAADPSVDLETIRSVAIEPLGARREVTGDARGRG